MAVLVVLIHLQFGCRQDIPRVKVDGLLSHPDAPAGTDADWWVLYCIRKQAAVSHPIRGFRVAGEAVYLSFRRILFLNGSVLYSSTLSVQVLYFAGGGHFPGTFDADTHHRPSPVPTRIRNHKFTQRTII